MWKKRRKKLVSDLAIAGKFDVSHTCQSSRILLTFIASIYSTGWMLCPIKEVMEDMQSAQNDRSAEERGEYILAVDRVIGKLFHENTEEELGIIKDTF